MLVVPFAGMDWVLPVKHSAMTTTNSEEPTLWRLTRLPCLPTVDAGMSSCSTSWPTINTSRIFKGASNQTQRKRVIGMGTLRGVIVK